MSTGELFKLITRYEPYDYQLRAWERVWEIIKNGGKVVIEVPTAGGKTEAAVIPFLAEAHNGTWAVSRLIYVLPTRSLVEKQAERIRKLLTEVLKLKGKSEEEAKKLTEKLVTVEYGLEQTHAFLGWVVVTTWDAFLYGLAAHRTVGRRFTFPAGAIAQSLVVFDEVQMYQDEGLYMPKLLSLVVRQLSEANVPVVVMSATIPTPLRRMIVGESEVVGVEKSDVRKPERGEVSIRVVEGTIEDVLDDIKEALSDGKRVLVVRNTVDKAITTYLWLKTLSKELGVETLLIHGRFAVGDRRDKENAIDSARLIVATQVVEAGLDLPNVGLVVTDIAPLDALIQRVGRCARRKGEVGKAIVLVEKANLGEFPEVKGFSEVLSTIREKIKAKIETEPFVEFDNHKDYKRVVKLTLDVPGKKQNVWYIGTPRTVSELGKKKKSPKDLLVVPYETLPYDPLVLLLSYDELGSLESYLYDVEKAREALDRVYRFHYANNLVPKEFHSAYIYFRELKLFSIPPEYELRSRPELYSMLYILDDESEGELKFKVNRVIRVSHSLLRANWGKLKDCITGKLVRRWDTKKERYHWVLEGVSEKSPKALAIYAVSGECYSRELGFWQGNNETEGEDETKTSQKTKTSKTNGQRRPKRKGQVTLLDFAGVRE
ncbi:CRISPR-associated helicase Cas3' [Thermococcus sp. 18S1]|nr:CRISPR-associated helicase Cas3' [Thermococcus sp. 18S1]